MLSAEKMTVNAQKICQWISLFEFVFGGRVLGGRGGQPVGDVGDGGIHVLRGLASA